MRRGTLVSLFVLLAVLSLGLKFVGWSRLAEPDPDRLHRDAARVLAANGFAVRQAGDDFVRPYLVARAGPCRIALGILLAGGAEAHAFAQVQRGQGRTRFFHNGAWSERPPRLQPLVERYIQQFGGIAGLAAPYPPLLAVSETGACPDLGPWLAGLRLFPLPRA